MFCFPIKNPATNFYIILFILLVSTSIVSANDANPSIKEKYMQQHQHIIPKVAVADMFYGCHQQDKIGTDKFTLNELINNMDKNELASRLSDCLGNNTIKSDKALNYGLKACFESQLEHLPEEERAHKMKLVNTAISSLSRSERQKSFTQCVTDQSVKYIK